MFKENSSGNGQFKATFGTWLQAVKVVSDKPIIKAEDKTNFINELEKATQKSLVDNFLDKYSHRANGLDGETKGNQKDFNKLKKIQETFINELKNSKGDIDQATIEKALSDAYIKNVGIKITGVNSETSDKLLNTVINSTNDIAAAIPDSAPESLKARVTGQLSEVIDSVKNARVFEFNFRNYVAGKAHVGSGKTPSDELKELIFDAKDKKIEASIEPEHLFKDDVNKLGNGIKDLHNSSISLLEQMVRKKEKHSEPALF